MIAKIAVAAAIYAIDRPYSYIIPAGMHIDIGMRVIVPFGRSNRRSEGIVLEIEHDPTAAGLKCIESVLDKEPVLSLYFIKIAAFLRDRYFCTFYDAIKTMLPAGLWFDKEELFSLTDKPLNIQPKKKELCCSFVLDFIKDKGGVASKKELYAAFDRSKEVLDRTVDFLLRRKYISSNVEFSKAVHDKTEQVASLAVPAEKAMEYASKRYRSAPVQAEVLKLLCSVGSGSTKEISYLTGASKQTLKRLESLGYISFSFREVFRTSVPDIVEKTEAIVLNAVQNNVFSGLRGIQRSPKPGVSLLYGVTGSGKTAVYIKLIEDVLSQGKDVIYLVPEIALTSQLIFLLKSHFGDDVAVLHSGLRLTERYDEWKRIRKGNAKIVVGTRSAVFAPVQSLGLLIVDEEHDHSYKSENSPRYHARETAIYRGVHEQALVLLGSATPSVESMYLAKAGRYHYFELRERFNGKSLPAVEVIDLKKEIRNGNSLSLSLPLLENIKETASNQKQSILFLNRRGMGRNVICVDCGNVPQCPRCSVSLTYHKANNRMMCHYCGHSQKYEDECNICGGAMKIIGTGTQKVEAELQERFPEFRILRMDSDTLSASNNHEAILTKFQKEQIPVLVGTQMVTKGLNFDNVTLVGVIDADMSLYVSHYRAAETTFSMLTQVIGRSGRGEYAGKAVIQTMTPEHTVIQLAAKQDYDQFYDLEIDLRRLHRCPPFADLFTVMFLGTYETDVVAASHRFRDMLCISLQNGSFVKWDGQILGPSPASIVKVNNHYRYRLTVRCENTKEIRLLISHLMKEFSKNKQNKGITIFADINSYE